MKTKILLSLACLFLIVGCKSENVNESHFASKSNISEDVVQQAKNLDKASYARLEHIFGDTEYISSEGKYVLLVFGKNGCRWCDQLKDELKEDKKTQEMLQANFKSYYINLSYSKIHNLDFDGKKSQTETSELARTYGIRPTPTSVFIDSKGKVIFAWPGYFSQPQMQIILEFIASGEYKKVKTQEEFFKMLDLKLKGIE